jgi:predicted CoA-binding protein
MKDLVRDLLAQKHIAVAGVSRDGDDFSNAIYRKLRDAGCQVYAVNPNASEVNGEPCYPDLSAVPAEIDGVMITTTPTATEQIVRECAELGIKRVWTHRNFGQGSYSAEAEAFCREHGINFIGAGCPMMFCEPVDFGHSCIRWIMGVTGQFSR